VLRSIIVLAAAAASACAEPPAVDALAQPTRLAPGELASVIKHQAYQSRLSIDGLGFLDSVLFVGTNVGLLEVQHGEVSALDQWFASDNVVSGPYRDDTRHRIWVKRDHDNVLLTHDAVQWRKIALPTPPQGYFTRGDILEGFRTAGDSSTLWLVGGGNVWRWSEPGAAWVLEPRPPTDSLSGIVGVATLGSRAGYIVSDGGCGYLPCVNQAYWRDGERWSPPVRLAIHGVAQVITASHGMYVRGDSGELLRLERDAAVSLVTPGPCDAVAGTSDGNLIASFRGAGLFVLTTRWQKLFDDPSPRVAGERFAYIAEHEGTIAFATSTVPQLKAGSSDRWYESGEVGLWISDGPRLVRVPLVGHQPGGARPVK
jgi:hypothetical protein